VRSAILIIGVAVLFLATGTAHAEEDIWWTDCRYGWITKHFNLEDPNHTDAPVFWQQGGATDGFSVRITHDELHKLLKDLSRMKTELKACDAYRKCLDDRAAGKVKHCYANDRRWREFYTGAW
jgi:hypothetical protein